MILLKATNKNIHLILYSIICACVYEYVYVCVCVCVCMHTRTCTHYKVQKLSRVFAI